MMNVDLALKMAETRMMLAIPNPDLWSGEAAQRCAESIERLAVELKLMQQRLGEWAY